MNFTTVHANLAQARAVVSKYGKVFIHGDGNLYREKSKSDHHKNFSNPDREEASYRVEYNSIEAVPKTLGDLNKQLLSAKNREVMEEKKPSSSATFDTIDASAFEDGKDEETEFVELSEEDFKALTPAQKGKYTKALNARKNKELE